MRLDFEFYTKGLENAICNLLRDGNSSLKLPGVRGAKEFGTYAGELDSENVVKALETHVRRFPLVLVSYGSGFDTRKSATNLLADEPVEFEHSCSFVVVCVDGDMRGSKQRKDSIFGMAADVYSALSGVQFEADFTDDAIGKTRREPLNHQPMLPVDFQWLVRLPEMTACAIQFGTSFHYLTPERRTVFAGNVEEILLSVVPTGDSPITILPANAPGVHGK